MNILLTGQRYDVCWIDVENELDLCVFSQIRYASADFEYQFDAWKLQRFMTYQDMILI